MALNQASALVEPCLLSEEHLPRRPRTGAAENDPNRTSKQFPYQEPPPSPINE